MHLPHLVIDMSYPVFSKNLTEKVHLSEHYTIQELSDRLNKLQTSRNRLQRLASLETWAIVGTMEEFVPGFWNRFMANRQVAFKEFLEQNKGKRK